MRRFRRSRCVKYAASARYERSLGRDGKDRRGRRLERAAKNAEAHDNSASLLPSNVCRVA
jgi:hypothetical protein